HDPERVPQVVDWARQAGLQVSLDLIYGTPGASLADWETSLRSAAEMGRDHVSASALVVEPGAKRGAAARRGELPMPGDDDEAGPAHGSPYALVVGPGPKMGAQVRRGELRRPGDDDEADKYELAADLLARAGYDWYEISNFARAPEYRCRHNIAYWRSQDWWGIGPGAHSHIGGQRWWNVKHPRPYAALLAGGRLPVAGVEELTAEQRADEEVLLAVRLADGLAVAAEKHERLPELVAGGLLEPDAAGRGVALLTLRGRLLADTVVRALVD